jgi:hypothetical protein
VDGVGIAERAVDVEEDGFQRRQLRQGAAAKEFRPTERNSGTATRDVAHDQRCSGGSPVGRHARRAPPRPRNAAAPLVLTSAEADAVAVADADSSWRRR